MTPAVRTKTAVYFLAFVVSGFAADAAEIRLKPQAQARGSIVLLGDVADVRAADPAQEAALKRVELFPAPSPGQSRSVRPQEVRELLGLHGFDVAGCEISGPGWARIFADARPASDRETRPETQKEVPAMVVAVRALEQGDTIRQADVSLQPLDRPLRDLTPVRGLSEAVGMEVTRPVASGQPLDGRYLRRPLLIHRGEMVTVYARAAGVCVRTSARALDDAAMDDLVMLESPGNRQRYTARVIGIQRAAVYASGIEVPKATAARGPVSPSSAIEADRR